MISSPGTLLVREGRIRLLDSGRVSTLIVEVYEGHNWISNATVAKLSLAVIESLGVGCYTGSFGMDASMIVPALAMQAFISVDLPSPPSVSKHVR
jgi:hypothetical protein